MLQPCANTNCSVQFAVGVGRCPARGTPAPQSAASIPGGGNRELTKDQVLGKQMLTVTMTLVVTSSVIISGLAAIGNGTGKLLTNAIRVTLTVCLCSALYQGSSIAKWITIAVLVPASLFSAALAILTGDSITRLVSIGN